MGEILLLLLFLFLSAFFSASEIALISLADFKVHHLKNKKLRGADVLYTIRQNKPRVLITVLIGNNIVNIGASALATKISISYFGDQGIGVAVGAMTFLILVFGEIMPKAFATTHATTVALRVAPIFRFLMVLFLPISQVFHWLTLIFPGNEKQSQISEEEIAILVDYGEKHGTIKSSERDMIHNIFKFDQLEVSEVMTPKNKVVFLKKTDPLEKALQIFSEHGYSKIPVLGEKNDCAVGVLFIKETITHIQKNSLQTPIDKMFQPAYTVPPSMKVDVLLREFLKKSRQMALIVDKNQKVMGIITLEDLLEEIVGEIVDETKKKR